MKNKQSVLVRGSQEDLRVLSAELDMATRSFPINITAPERIVTEESGDADSGLSQLTISFGSDPISTASVNLYQWVKTVIEGTPVKGRVEARNARARDPE